MRVIGYVVIIILLSFVLSLNVFRIFPVDETSLFLTVIGLIYGLIAAFTINNSWERFSKIRDAISQENSSLINLYLILRKFADKKTLNRFSGTVVEYFKSVLNVEWKEYWYDEKTHAEFRKLFDILGGIKIRTKKDEVLLQQSYNELQDASTARTQQLVLSHSSISKVQWALILFLSFILIISLVFLELAASVVSLFVSTAMIASVILILLVIYEIDSLKVDYLEVSSEPAIEVVKLVSKNPKRDVPIIERLAKEYS